MKRFFLDTEFIEDGERIHPLAVALVDEDGAAFYAVITDVDRVLAGDWVKANVLPYIDEQPPDAECITGTRSEVAEGIRQWVADRTDTPEFWADYAAYDWVLLCQLYGTMLDLPEGWPMFVRDIQQIRPSGMELPQPEHEHQAVSDARNCRDRWLILSSHDPQPGGVGRRVGDLGRADVAVQAGPLRVLRGQLRHRLPGHARRRPGPHRPPAGRHAMNPARRALNLLLFHFRAHRLAWQLRREP